MSLNETASVNAAIPQHINELVRAGAAHYSSRDYESALEAYAKAYSQCPLCEDAGLGLANSMMSVGRVEDAVKVCGEMKAALPRSKEPRLMLGRIYYRAFSNYPGALAEYQEALKLAPGDAEILHGVADIYFAMNELENAADYYSRAIEKAPERLEAYSGLASVFMTAKDHQAALGVYDRAIAAMPDSADAYCRKGDVYKEMENKAEAERCYRKAFEIDPKNAVAYNKMGLLKVASPFEFRKPHHKSYFNRLHLDEAIFYYEKAVENDPGFGPGYYNLCLAYYEIGCYEEALHNIKIHLSLDRSNSMAWYYRSILSERLGRLNEAIYSNNYAIFLVRNDMDSSGEPRMFEWLDNHGRKLSELYYVKTPQLNKHGRDLTRAAADFKFDRHIGRERELNQLVQILAGKAKNDALIIGEPGVGKTALVHALADMVVAAGPGHPLEGYRIIEVNLSTLFEENPGPANLNALLQEAENNPGIILFVDEIHKIINYGDIFKPAIESSSVRFVTTTTFEGYQKLETIDSTLERKFEKLNLPEPSREETLEILNGIKADFEYFHRVSISAEAIESAVDLTMKFISDRKLPDKAIDAIDKACSGARMRPKTEAAENASVVGGGVKENNGGSGEGGIRAGGVDGANENRTADGAGSSQSASGAEKVAGGAQQLTITAGDIASVIADKTSIPLEIISGNLRQNRQMRIGELRRVLKSVIFGQDAAIDAIADRLIMAYSGLSNKRGPMSVFLLIGPSGVGKTETARQLAKFLFGSESSILRMGLIGFEDANFLARLNTRPHSIVLFDEVDKANPDFVDDFLKIFDEGHITQPSGKLIDVSNTIFIMTSNLLPEKHITLGSAGAASRGRESKIAVDDLKAFYRPEFLNRIDEIIVYNKLTENEVLKILDLMIDELNASVMKQYDAEIKFDETARRAIAKEGFSEVYGARELRRDFEKMVKVPLGELILNREILRSKSWKVVAPAGAGGKMSIVKDSVGR